MFSIQATSSTTLTFYYACRYERKQKNYKHEKKNERTGNKW